MLSPFPIAGLKKCWLFPRNFPPIGIRAIPAAWRNHHTLDVHISRFSPLKFCPCWLKMILGHSACWVYLVIWLILVYNDYKFLGGRTLHKSTLWDFELCLDKKHPMSRLMASHEDQSGSLPRVSFFHTGGWLSQANLPGTIQPLTPTRMIWGKVLPTSVQITSSSLIKQIQRGSLHEDLYNFLNSLMVQSSFLRVIFCSFSTIFSTFDVTNWLMGPILFDLSFLEWNQMVRWIMIIKNHVFYSGNNCFRQKGPKDRWIGWAITYRTFMQAIQYPLPTSFCTTYSISAQQHRVPIHPGDNAPRCWWRYQVILGVPPLLGKIAAQQPNRQTEGASFATHQIRQPQPCSCGLQEDHHWWFSPKFQVQ